MSLRFAVRLAGREARYGLRRVGVYMTSIALGVAALVALHSFRDDVARSVREEAESLMGADARLAASRPLPDSVEAVVDSLAPTGVDVGRVTTATSMVLATRSGSVRLLQVRGIEGGYPFYGRVRTDPEGMWPSGLSDGQALVDPAVLSQLDAEVGDTLLVGRTRVVISGVVDDLPTDLGFQSAIGPRVHMSAATLDRAALLGFGSLARYEVFLRLPEDGTGRLLRERYGTLLSDTQINYTLAEEQAQSLSNAVRFLGRFLSLIGLGALLLGGIGVASAIHVYIRERRPGVAVLRCLGAGQWTVFTAYLIQAGGLGLMGSALGVVVGVGVQQLLPFVLADALPVEVSTRFSWSSAAAGLGIGVWVAVIFALIPLLQLRDVPPLAALRTEFGPPPSGKKVDPVRLAAWAALLGSVVALCMVEAPEPEVGLGFAAVLTLTVVLLAGAGWALTRLTRRFFPSRAPYPVRQGVSNLFRPRNQTVAVTLALGFGAFVVGGVLSVQESLMRDLSRSFGDGQPNVLLFDVQPDQRDGILALLPASARGAVDVAPLVPSRLVAINGRSRDELRADTTGRRPEAWALRREYRNTFRDQLGPAEELVSGRWWDGTPGAEDGREVPRGGLPGVSLELDIADDLAVELGDVLTWDVAGVEVSTVVTSLRRVFWERLEPNFFAVLEPGALEGAPYTLIMVARVPDAGARATFQRDLVLGYPNVSALDFSRVQEAIDAVLSRVRQAVGFLGGFAALAGLFVLMGSVAASRSQRMREGALLKTLGARRRQVLVVLLTEYLALGTLATATGLGLALGISAVAVPRLFEVDFHPPVAAMVGLWLAVVGLTVAVGLAGSRSLLAQPPLAVLREAPE